MKSMMRPLCGLLVAFAAVSVSFAATPLEEKIAADHRILTSDTWGGGHRIIFDFNGRKGWVVEPPTGVRPLRGKPWLWTMQWMGAFLNRTGAPLLTQKGFHHVHLEAFDLRANEEGLKAFADYQRYLVEKLGFNGRADLIGMSWGGFFSVRYAAAYPQNVDKIYLDAPLLNFTGFAAANLSPADLKGRIGPWAETAPADGNWTDDPRMPVNMAKRIADVGIPVYLLYGGQDQSCNPALNSERFVKDFQAAGGVLKVQRRGGYGHHPHGFEEEERGKIVDFFTKHDEKVELPFARTVTGPVPREKMQETVQKILDEGVAAGWQSCVQCCVYIDGKLVVDAWAGVMDKASKKPIDGDTLLPIFSTEKPILATAMHRAKEQGLVRYDDPVVKHWPEFRDNPQAKFRGKEQLTVRQLLGHRAGMPSGFYGAVPDEKLVDWDYMAKRCAEADPVRTPGTSTGYLSQSYAWYVGVPLTKIFKRPINDLLIEQVLRPAGIENDFFFSVPDDRLPRCATVYADNAEDGFLRMNQDLFRKACIPSAYAAASARGIAKFYNRLCGMDGKPGLLSPETIAEASVPERWSGEPLPPPEELVAKWQMVFGLGWGVWGDPDDIGRIIGQGGVGGSEGYGDVRSRIAIGYTCGTSVDTPRHDLRFAIYRACGVRTRHMPRPLYSDTKLKD